MKRCSHGLLDLEKQIHLARLGFFAQSKGQAAVKVIDRTGREREIDDLVECPVQAVAKYPQSVGLGSPTTRPIPRVCFK